MTHNPYRATAQRPDDGQSFQVESLPYQSIRVVRRDQLDSATAQTPGSQRLAAIHPGAGMDSPVWGGAFLVEPAARTGIHHHGEQPTIAYVLSGSSYIRWGERGEFYATLHAGDFLYVPARLPHQENQPFEDSPLPMDRRTEHFRTNRRQFTPYDPGRGPVSSEAFPMKAKTIRRSGSEADIRFVVNFHQVEERNPYGWNTSDSKSIGTGGKRESASKRARRNADAHAS